MKVCERLSEDLQGTDPVLAMWDRQSLREYCHP